MSLNPTPQEMSDAALESLFPDQNQYVKPLPLEDAYDLLETVNTALLAESAKPTSAYNPDKLTIYNFRWAYLQYHKTEHLCPESIATGKAQASDVSLIPLNGCQTFMFELTKLARLGTAYA